MTLNKLPYPESPCDVQVELTVYPMFDGGRGALKLPFVLTRGQEVMEALNLFMRRHHVHATLTTSLLSLINDAIRTALRANVNDAFLKSISNKSVEEIKAEAVAFNKRFSSSKDAAVDQVVFPRAIKGLCTAPKDYGLLPHLVKLQEAYDQAYTSRMENWDSQMDFITIQQHDEIQDGRQNLSEQTLNAKRLQFSRDFDMLKQTRDAELSELRETQQAEFRQWVGLLYTAYQAWLNKDGSVESYREFNDQFGDHFGSAEDLAPATFQYYFPERQNASKELAGALGLDKRPASTVAGDPAQPTGLANSDPAVRELQVMGFGETDARCALRLANGNMDGAIALLLDLPDQLQIEIQKEATRPKTPPTDAKAGTNLLDMTRNWLGKTFESLSREDSRNGSESTPKELRVAFAAVLGSHLRTPYQITLTASDPLKDDSKEARLDTLELLYRPELTFRLVFFHPKHGPKYPLGRVANAWLFEACGRSNELHFPSLSHQLAAALDRLQAAKASLQEGDFLLTRHSNLANTHVVIHMALDHASETFPEDLNQRPLLIGGVRTLLTTVQRYGASKLVLPPPELNAPAAPTSLSQKLAASSNPNMDPSLAAKIKLFETFFRCIKGLLLETNRSGSVPYPILPGASIPPVLGLTFLLPPTTNVSHFKKARACIRAAFNP